MGYLGSKQIKFLRDKPKFVKITKAGFYESMVHNVDIVKNDNKYWWLEYLNKYYFFSF